MKLFIKDFDKYNYTYCHYTQKVIRAGEPHYAEMHQSKNGNGWVKGRAVKASKAQQMIAAGEAKVVTRAELSAE
jgi:hypothetical protein